MKSLTVGIIGVGRIGKLHIKNLISTPYVTVKSISDIDKASVMEWADSLSIQNVVKDYHKVIHDPEIDVVFICSPTDSHTSIIKEAARAGKHIFCEKPISLDIEETKEALKVVRKYGVQFQTGFNRRFDHNFKRVRDLMMEKKVGSPHVVRVTSRDPEPPPKDYIKGSGGIFIDMSIHDFDMARFLCGDEVEEVYAQGAVLVDPVFANFDDVDTAVITLKFKNGALGVIDNSRKAVYGYDQRVEVFGSDGCITVSNDFPNSAELSTNKGVYQDKPKYFFLERYRESYIEEIKSFIHCLRNGTDVIVNGNDGLQAELIAFAAKKSFKEGRAVKLETVLKTMQGTV